MEKRDEPAKGDAIKIAVIGPESTGKTTLSEQLGKHFSTLWIPEFARKYCEELKRKYTFDDVECIAREQLKQIQNTYEGLVFFDTDLIITKIWFEVVFHHCPKWIDNEISKKFIDFYLLCDTDIPWIWDSVRENGGEMREKLFRMYQSELEKNRFDYAIISGLGDKRLDNAIQEVNNYLNGKRKF